MELYGGKTGLGMGKVWAGMGEVWEWCEGSLREVWERYGKVMEEVRSVCARSVGKLCKRYATWQAFIGSWIFDGINVA